MITVTFPTVVPSSRGATTQQLPVCCYFTSKRNGCILAKCKWRTLGFPCAFAVCECMERGRRHNGPFHLSDSSTDSSSSDLALVPHLFLSKECASPNSIGKKKISRSSAKLFNVICCKALLCHLYCHPSLVQSCYSFLSSGFTQTLTFLQFGQKAFLSSNTIETDIHSAIL